MYFNKIAWMRKTDEEKAKIVCDTLSMITHNGITKDDLVMMLDWCFHEIFMCNKPCDAHCNRCKQFGIIDGGKLPQPYKESEEE